MRKLTHIVIHCSDSLWGDVEDITQWHTLPKPKGRGWKDIGYHYVIANGFPNYDNKASNKPDHFHDGLVQLGRPIEMPGSHAQNFNKNSIGICMIGVNYFTDKQLYSLRTLLINLMQKYGIPKDNIIGHRDVMSAKLQGKTCPNFDVKKFVKESL